MTTENNTEEHNPATEADTSESKTKKLTEKLQSMGVMPGDKEAPAVDKPAPAVAGRARFPVPLAITLSAMAIVIIALAFIQGERHLGDKGSEVATQQPVGVVSAPVGYPVASTLSAPARPAVVWPVPLSTTDRQQLIGARQAFWQRDTDKAEQAYRELLQRVTDNPDIRGELGDVLYYKQKPVEALQHYTQAALLLIKQNRYAELGHAISVVGRLDQQQANALLEKLSEQQRAHFNVK